LKLIFTNNIYQKDKRQKPMSTVHDYPDFCVKAGFDYKDYQHSGVSFCKSVEENTQWRGGLIADEMGLGKTIMMLGLITCNYKSRTLIVLPLALLRQWQSIIQTHLKHTPMVFHGPGAKKYTKDQVEQSPIVLTTYGSISSPVPRKGKLHPPPVPCILKNIAWDRVIFDEGHHLRNAKTGRHLGALNIKAECRWIVTGTPIQNRKSDFYALCAQMGFSPAFYSNPANLMTIAKNHILRRTKSEVGIQLPPLTEQKHILHWENEEERNVAEQIHSLIYSSNDKTTPISSTVHGFGDKKLPLMVRARQVCVCPPLLLPKIRDILDLDNDKPLGELEEKLLLGASKHSKIDAAIKAIAARKENKRSKLLFCSYRGEIDLLKYGLLAKGFSVSVLDGRATIKARQSIISDETVDVMILQTQTGCEGLNLQRFSEVYFMSPHWNPAVEDQAIARAHRLGQTQKVDVFRFIMSDFSKTSITIERAVMEKQEQKRQMAHELTAPDKQEPVSSSSMPSQ
jgi:SNF2 family DNA or RNA helicase